MLASVQAVETVDSLQSDLDKAQEEIEDLRRQASDNNALLRQVQAESELVIGHLLCNSLRHLVSEFVYYA